MLRVSFFTRNDTCHFNFLVTSVTRAIFHPRNKLYGMLEKMKLYELGYQKWNFMHWRKNSIKIFIQHIIPIFKFSNKLTKIPIWIPIHNELKVGSKFRIYTRKRGSKLLICWITFTMSTHILLKWPLALYLTKIKENIITYNRVAYGSISQVFSQHYLALHIYIYIIQHVCFYQ